MRKSFTFPAILSTFILAVMPLLMGAGPTPDPAEEPGAATNEIVMPDQPMQRTTVSPLMQEIKATLAAGDELLAALQLQLTSAPDETEALRLLNAIQQQKQDTEISILRIQERYAREAGDTETAEKINLAVSKILNPPVPEPNTQARAESETRRGGGEGHD